MSAELGRIANYVSSGSFWLLSLGHLIVFAHLLGGVLLVLGMLTRFACLINDTHPSLALNHLWRFSQIGLWTPFAEVLLAILVFLLLCYFLVAGNGRWSFDKYIDATTKCTLPDHQIIRSL